MQADFEVLDTIIDAMTEELRSIREEADRTQDLIKKFSVQYALLKKELGDCRKKAVPAIHCRDCMHWNRNYHPDVETCSENREVDGAEQETPPYGWCHKEERRKR